MLLNITYNGQDTTKLGYLLYKNPSRPQAVKLNFGKAYIFYPELSDAKTTVSLLLDIDPIDLARGKAGSAGSGLFDYVNDRPYVSSSFMSTAISKVFGTAMTGRADEHQDLSDQSMDLTAEITMLPCSGDTQMVERVFAPLGYEVAYENFVADEMFPEWGESRYINLSIKGRVRLRDLLRHIYVLLPVFDRQKHYWVGKDEVEKLLRNAEDWLKDHPEKAYITGRYLSRRRSLINLAMKQLEPAEPQEAEEEPDNVPENTLSEAAEPKLNLNTRRLRGVVDTLKSLDVHSVIDIGCGEGNLLSYLMKESRFQKVTGVDVSYSVLEKAKSRLKVDRMGDYMREKLELFQGSLTYKDNRFKGYDAVCVIEVIEHLDLSRLTAFERVIFEYTRPRYVVLTTPNKEYNEVYESMAADSLRHTDHRFEWSRREFREWAEGIAAKYKYTVEFKEIGDLDEKLGSPTQMGVFKCV